MPHLLDSKPQTMGILGAFQLLYFKTGPCSLSICEVKHTAFSGGQGTNPKQKAIEMEASAQSQKGFLCRPAGSPIHMNGASWRPVNWPSCCPRLSSPTGWGNLWKIQSTNQSTGQPLSLLLWSAWTATCDLLRWRQKQVPSSILRQGSQPGEEK